MSRLSRPRTMKERFRLPFDENTATALLRSAVEGEVCRFGGTFLYSDAVESQVRSLAASLTSGRRCGVMLCGLCGNGKTTVMRAFQRLLNVVRIPDNFHRNVYGMPIVNAIHIAHLCRSNYDEFLRLCDHEMLGIDDMGTEPLEVQEFGNMHRPLTDLLIHHHQSCTAADTQAVRRPHCRQAERNGGQDCIRQPFIQEISVGRTIITTAMYTATARPCRACADIGMCPGSKYRFCVPQNRRACQSATGHGRGKEEHL